MFLTGFIVYYITSGSTESTKQIDRIFAQFEKWIKDREINRLCGTEGPEDELDEKVIAEF